MSKNLCLLFKKLILAMFGLIICGLGVYLQLQSNIGSAPWNALSQGFANTFSMAYGNAHILIGYAIILLDVYLKEPLGIGMLLDAYLVGATVDVADRIQLVNLQSEFFLQVITLTAGMVAICVGQWLYMSAGLGCGPRDALLIALSKRAKKLTVGTVSSIIFLVILVVAYLLKATIGIGTLMCVFLMGPILDLVFKLANFNARAVHHESVKETYDKLFKA